MLKYNPHHNYSGNSSLPVGVENIKYYCWKNFVCFYCHTVSKLTDRDGRLRSKSHQEHCHYLDLITQVWALVVDGGPLLLNMKSSSNVEYQHWGVLAEIMGIWGIKISGKRTTGKLLWKKRLDLRFQKQVDELLLGGSINHFFVLESYSLYCATLILYLWLEAAYFRNLTAIFRSVFHAPSVPLVKVS